MSVNILGGVAKGFSLVTPKSFKTRPTSVLLKRRLFDSIQDFSETIFIDLCAGSGSIGIEALSRNASEVYFVELANHGIQSIKTNLKKMKEKYPELGEYKLIKEDCIKWIRRNKEFLESTDEKYLFFDPPYEEISLYKQFWTTLTEVGYRGVVIVEACTQKTMPVNQFEESFGQAKKIYKQGTSFFAVYEF